MLTNQLPGDRRPYLIQNGQGPRHLLGGLVASAYATGAETDGAFCLHMLTGGKGAGLPLIRHHDSHTSLYVMDGTLTLTLAGATYHLCRGDLASIPPGVEYGFAMTRHRNVVMSFQTGAAAGGIYAALGTPYQGLVQPETDAGTAADLAQAEIPDHCETTLIGPLPTPGAPSPLLTDLPKDTVPYVLEGGEGERLVVADQTFTFAGLNQNTNDLFLTLFNEGPAGDMIPPHKHLLHDEMFFCLDGTIRMKAGDELIDITPGDFLFVPRNTPHAFQMLGGHNKTLGWLIPGVFQDFFFTLGAPYAPHIYPQEPHAFRFDKVLAKLDQLDIVPLGGPPGAPPQS